MQLKLSNQVLLVVVGVSSASCAGSSPEEDSEGLALATTVAPSNSNAPTSTAGAQVPAMTSGSSTPSSPALTSTAGAMTPQASPGPSDAPEPTVSPGASAAPSSSAEPSPAETAPSHSTTTDPADDPTPSMSGEPQGEGGAPDVNPTATGTTETPPPDDSDVVDVGADEKFSFFVTSYYHIKLLSGSDDGFGGDLRWNGAATGLEGADALCQEMARRVSFGHRTWRAYLSTSTVNAIDRVGDGPWYDFTGALVAEDVAGLLVPKAEQDFEGGGFGGGGFGGGMGGGLSGGTCSEGDGERPAGGALDCGTYDETGLLHDGLTDQDGDGVDDDDHDTMTATLADGTYAGFSCDDWTSTTATPEGEIGPRNGGILMGHSWPAGSGLHWSDSHAGHSCAAGTNFVQDGPGDSSTVGGGGGYGGFYCFAVD